MIMATIISSLSNRRNQIGQPSLLLNLISSKIDVIPPGEYWEPCEESPFISIDSAYDTTEYNLSFNDKAIVVIMER